MLRKLLLGVVALVFAVGLATTVQYRLWLGETIQRLEAGSTVVQTSLGDVEYAAWDDSGPVILFLHGTPGGYDQSGRLGPLALDAGYRVVAPSRPGYLRTPLAVGRTPAEQADAAAALLTALDIDRAAVVGASGGGPSALQFALRHPDRCWAHVQLMGVSRARLPSEGGRSASDEEPEAEPPFIARFLSSNFGGWVLGRLGHMNPEATLEGLMPDPANRQRILDDPAKLAGFLALTDSATSLAAHRQEGARNDFLHFADLAVPDLASIRCPTLVLHGTADTNVAIAMGELVANGVPGAEMVRFEGADHFMVISHAEEVMGALFRFADRHSGRAPD